MKTVFIVDIDTTIANNAHREHLLVHGPDGKVPQEAWDAFLDPLLIAQDTVDPHGQRSILAMRSFEMEMHFITGRNERLRDVTEFWLRENVGWNPRKERLLMRDLVADKNVPASVYKEKQLKRLIQEENLTDASFIFFEDDPWVFAMYRKYGLVIKCPEGWEHFDPQHATEPEAAWRK